MLIAIVAILMETPNDDKQAFTPSAGPLFGARKNRTEKPVPQPISLNKVCICMYVYV